MLILRLQTTMHRKNSMQCCPSGSRQHCTGKNPMQCFLNTTGTVLNTSLNLSQYSWNNIAHKKPFAMLSGGSRKHCTGKNPMQCFFYTPGTILNTSVNLS